MVLSVKSVNCPFCGTKLNTTNCRPLKDVKCPACGGKVKVPGKHGSMRVLRKIGEGTGSIIFEADDRVLGRRVALKVMKSRGKNDLGKQDIMDEARSLMMLDHPNIVKVFAIDTHTGELCVIMELLEGGSMKDLIQKNGTVDEDRALEIAIDVAKGLDAAHLRGLFHLDVKPANIMLDKDGTAKVVDFGYAMYGLDADVAENEVPGTPYYVAPELVEREPPDLRADIYSLGATLFHAITGRAPFVGESIRDIVRARVGVDPPNIKELKPDAHDAVANVVERMMEEEPSERYRDYASLIEALQEARQAMGAKA